MENSDTSKITETQQETFKILIGQVASLQSLLAINHRHSNPLKNAYLANYSNNFSFNFLAHYTICAMTR